MHISSLQKKMTISILILLVTLPIILMTYLHRKSRKTSVPLVPPGPPGLPLIGNLHSFATATDLHIYLSQLSKKYGPLMHMKLGSIPVLVISSAELTKQFFKTHDLAFLGRRMFLGQRRLSYGGLDIAFAPYRDYWRELRKVTTIHLFSLRKTQAFGPLRADQVSRMIARVSGHASTGEVLNLSDMTFAFSSTLICRIAFGKRYDDEHGSEMRRFDELLHEAQALMATFFVSDYFPAFGWVDRLTGLISRLDKAFERLDSFYQEVIDEHLDPNRPKPTEDDILDTLIQLKEHKATSSVDLDWVNIKALLMNIFVAATDTGAATIVWIMTALTKAPRVMQRVQAEIRNSVGEKGKVEEDDLPKLPYLKATINESFRLYPPAPLLVARESIERCTLDGYQVEPKTMVYVNAWAVARDPEYWENPDEFLPERFLNSGVDVRGQCYGVVPFGSGRRMCPGMLMGIANVELAVANLLYSFDWEFPSGVEAKDVDTDVLPGLTMHKKNALLLVPKKYYVV